MPEGFDLPLVWCSGLNPGRAGQADDEIFLRDGLPDGLQGILEFL